MIYALMTVGIILFITFFVRWFEWSNIYFPYKFLGSAPSAIGLSYEDVYFETSDGANLNGWFVPCDNPRATVIFCHGNAGNISHRLDIIRMLNSLGLNVFIFDYRGYGKSSGWPSEKGTYLDLLAAHDYVLNRDDVDKEKIILYGKSLGGAVAAEVATKNGFYAVILDSVFTSTVDMAREIFPFLPVDLIITIKYDTISKIDELSMPKLVIHSKDDEIVPFSHGEKLFEKAKEPKEFYAMHGGHNDAIIIYQDDIKEKIDAFLKKTGI